MEGSVPELPDEEDAAAGAGDQVADPASTQPGNELPGDLSTSGDDDYVPA